MDDAVAKLESLGCTMCPVGDGWRATFGNADVVLHPNGSITSEGVELWSWHDEGWADDVLEMFMEQL